MRNQLIFGIGLCCVLVSSCNSVPSYRVPEGAYKEISIQDTRRNIILLTLDGVRWQEAFHGTDPELDHGAREKVIFLHLMQRLSLSGTVMGDRENGSEMLVSNPSFISLPAYQSILSGLTQNCFSNSCSRVPVNTVQERLLDSLKLEKEKVATLASWSKISLAAEHHEGRTRVNSGMSLVEDKLRDAELELINQNQFSDRPSWDEARSDKYTTQLALWYLKKYQPRFLYISLNDSDEWGHDGNYPKYVQTLHQYDDFIDTLLNTLEKLGDYGRSTILLVTTDHGRGNRGDWTDHGSSTSDSQYIWLAAVGTPLKNKIITHQVYHHNDLVPTILSMMGIEVQLCEECGVPIKELLSSLGPLNSDH